jgi:protein-tyrosine phosphatase
VSDDPLLRLASAPNFRDAGGAPVGGGRGLRRRLLFRSEALTDLTDHDADRLDGLGIQLVCDLRTDGERARHPSRWPRGSAIETMHIDLLVRVTVAHGGGFAGALAETSGVAVRRWMTDRYAAMPGALAGRLPVLLDRIVTGRGIPTLVHCSAGKDRTGVVCAILQLAAGVSRDDIHADYLASAGRYDSARVAAMFSAGRSGTTSLSPAARAALGCGVEYLDAALDRVLEHGSVERYITATGVPAATVAAYPAAVTSP